MDNEKKKYNESSNISFIKSFKIIFNNYLLVNLEVLMKPLLIDEIRKEFCYYAFAHCSTIDEVQNLALSFSNNIKNLNTGLLGNLFIDCFKEDNFLEIISLIDSVCKLFNNAYSSLQMKNNIMTNDIYIQTKMIKDIILNNNLEGNEKIIVEKAYIIEEDLFIKAIQNKMLGNTR